MASVVVVGTKFTAPNPVDLTIVRKIMTISAGNFEVTDANGNIVFNVKGKALSFHSRRILLDAAGTPVVSFRDKMRSMHSEWKVYRGDSEDDPEDLLFIVRRPSMFFQYETELNVFLASNTSKDNWDFKIKGGLFEKSSTNDAEKSFVIGQLQRKDGFRSAVFGKDRFAVIVNPHVDYAFIVTLAVILQEIDDQAKSSAAGIDLVSSILTS